jgi:hypothetical protein
VGEGWFGWIEGLPGQLQTDSITCTIFETLSRLNVVLMTTYRSAAVLFVSVYLCIKNVPRRDLPKMVWTGMMGVWWYMFGMTEDMSSVLRGIPISI